MTDTVCKKCKEPCDNTCAACKKGYILHYRCMKPGDRLAVWIRHRTWYDATSTAGVIGLVLFITGSVVLPSIWLILVGGGMMAVGIWPWIRPTCW